jgi:hypothetical protein
MNTKENIKKPQSQEFTQIWTKVTETSNTRSDWEDFKGCTYIKYNSNEIDQSCIEYIFTISTSLESYF